MNEENKPHQPESNGSNLNPAEENPNAKLNRSSDEPESQNVDDDLQNRANPVQEKPAEEITQDKSVVSEDTETQQEVESDLVTETKEPADETVVAENKDKHDAENEPSVETRSVNPDPVPVTEEQFLESAPEVVSDETHDEEDHETDLQENEDYSTYSREDLVKLLEDFVNEVEVPRFKSRIADIRDFLSHAFNEDQAELLDKFIADGGIKDDFQPTPDPIEERFHLAIKKFHHKRIEYQQNIEKQRKENLTAKNDILNQLKDLIQNEDNMNKAFERFHELQASWRTVGPVPSAEVRHLQLSYKFLIDKFYDFIKINRELQDLDQRKNLEAKLQLCEQADELLMEPSLNTAFRKLHVIQDKWRETGPVPREQKNEIWDRFKSTCDKLFEKRREYIAGSEVKRKANLEAKILLCEKAEAIIGDENWKHKEWQESTGNILEIQAEWKKTGRADKKVNDEIWNRFKAACDKFYKAKNDFYHKRKQELSANLQKKTELCIQAEALQNSTDWKTTTAELKRLQDEWKHSGPVPDKHSDKIWKRFRHACDGFFQNKHDHFSSRDKEFEENLVKKNELITAIENYAGGDDSRASFEDLKNFQRQWSDLGMVPLNKKEEINNKYKKVIDAHFDKLKISSGDRQKMRYQNKLEQIKHSDDPKKMDHEKRHLLNKITELKNEVQVWENNIGFFAKSKNAEKLKSEFEDKILKAKEEIDSLKHKLDMSKED